MDLSLFVPQYIFSFANNGHSIFKNSLHFFLFFSLLAITPFTYLLGITRQKRRKKMEQGFTLSKALGRRHCCTQKVWCYQHGLAHIIVETWNFGFVEWKHWTWKCYSSSSSWKAFFSSRNNKGCKSFETCFGNWTLAGCFVKCEINKGSGLLIMVSYMNTRHSGVETWEWNLIQENAAMKSLLDTYSGHTITPTTHNHHCWWHNIV